MAELPTYEQMAKKVAEKALSEILYDGKSIREWMKVICESDHIGKWIPVSERLPERSVWVLAYCKRKDGYEYQEVLLIDKYSGLWSFDDEISDTVIAWMPLPEPYKAESETQE